MTHVDIPAASWDDYIDHTDSFPGHSDQPYYAGSHADVVDPGGYADDAIVPFYSNLADPPMQDAMCDIRGNFCGEYDSQSDRIFDPKYIGLPAAKRELWRQEKLAAGHTHVVVMPFASWSGQAPVDCTLDPAAFTGYLDELLNDNLYPIVFLTTGDPGSWEGSFGPGGWVEAFLTGMQSYAWACLWVPGWEVRGPGANWTSHQLCKAIRSMREGLGQAAHLYVHFQPTVVSGASWPPEADDPWQSDQAAFWSTQGGNTLTGLLYSTEVGGPLITPSAYPNDAGGSKPEYTDYPGIFGHLYEMSKRGLIGAEGWRQYRICVFETVAYDFYNNGLYPAYAREIAQAIHDKMPAYRDFGNGYPYSFQP